MNEYVRRHIYSVIESSPIEISTALEVGGYPGKASILRTPRLDGCERYCLNLENRRNRDGIRSVHGDANRMSMFADSQFDLVLSNAMLEHDKRFWLSLAEMKRVLRPGGLLVIGVPGFTRGGSVPHPRSTLTFEVHFAFDYYRFSEQAAHDVFFTGYEDVEVAELLTPPRLVGCGYKPTSAAT